MAPKSMDYGGSPTPDERVTSTIPPIKTDEKSDKFDLPRKTPSRKKDEEKAEETFVKDSVRTESSNEAQEAELKTTSNQQVKYESPLHELSDLIFIQLLKWNRNDSDFRFWLRTKDSNRSKEPRLERGQWFQGSDYIWVGFSAITDGKNKTQSIGFVLQFEEEKPFFLIKLGYQSEHRPPVLECYALIEKYLSKEPTVSANGGGGYTIKINNWYKALEFFVNVAYVEIYRIIQEHNLMDVFDIPKEKFETNLERTLKIREQLYGKLKPELEQVHLQTESLDVEDKLGRQPFVDSLKSYVEKLWAEKKNDAYTIHLGGEWGSGKSKVLQMLKTDLEKSNQSGDWVVVDFNAWQNQHIESPWWIFMDNVYKGIKQSKGHKWGIWWRERWWRLISLNKVYFLSFLVLTGLLLLITFTSGFEFLNFFDLLDDSVNGGKKASVVTSYITILGVLWTLFKSLNGSLISGSENAAKEFKEKVRDPMDHIKTHYKKVIGYTNKNVAVFIDDIDRCNPDFVVRLLEGLQTLFKSTKVLYVIAGDGNWIKKSFEIYYSQLEDAIKKDGTTIGNFFLEKTFQMSISVPRISDETRELFWKYLLKGSTSIDVSTQLSDEINQASTEAEIDEAVQKAVTPEEKILARQAAVKRMSEQPDITEEAEHKLEKYHSFLEPNARSMKRLINNYALERKAMILSGISLKDVSEENLIKWIILKSRFPVITDELSIDPNTLEDKIKNDNAGELKVIAEGLSPEILTKCIKR